MLILVSASSALGADSVRIDNSANSADGVLRLKPKIKLPQTKSSQNIPPTKTKSSNQDDLSAFDKLESKETILVNPEKLIVKPPMLKALIRLQQPVSPLHIEADSNRDTNLGEVLKTALRNNLDIKISKTDEKIFKMTFYERLSNFLPDFVGSVSYQGLKGVVASPAGAILNIDSQYLTTGSGFKWNIFEGGARIYETIKSKHLYKASKSRLKGTINDVLYKATKLYYELVLNDALLQIRVKNLEESKAISKLNQDLYDEGVATKLDLMQAKSEESRSRQQLVSQQIKRREAAVNLSTALYLDPAIDLNIQNRTIQMIRLLARNTRISPLIATAVTERPELHKLEERRLAALQRTKIARAGLMPSVSFSGAIAGTGADISRGAGPQQIPLSSVTSAGSTVTPSVSGGATTPLAQGAGGTKKFNTRALFVIGVDTEWKLGGMGATDLIKMRRAKYLARLAQLNYNKQLATVYQEVRNSYNHAIDTETLVRETTAEVNSSEEALRIAVLRLKEGLGTQTDVIIAQRDYTRALINKARAIIDFNLSQAEILHSTGVISFNTLTRGYRP